MRVSRQKQLPTTYRLSQKFLTVDMAWRNDQQLFESLPVCPSLEFNYLSFFLALTTRALFSASLGSTHSLLFYLTHLLFYLELIASLAIVYPCKLSMVCGFYSKPFSHLQYSFPPGKKKNKQSRQPSTAKFTMLLPLSWALFWRCNILMWVLCSSYFLHNSLAFLQPFSPAVLYCS